MAKPAVDGLAGDLAERGVQMLRVSVSSSVGRQISGQYGVRAVPTLILFDSEGQPVLTQIGQIDAEAVLAWLETFE